MLQKQTKQFTLSIVVMVLFWACGNSPVFESYKTIPDAQWNKDSVANFSLEVTDTSTFHDFFLHLRNNNEYPFSNFYAFLTITFPNKKTAKDTLNLPLADLKGKWLGTGIGEIKSTRFLFREKLRFPIPGKYTFSIRQGMRKDDLKGITDIGLEIVKTQ